MAQESWWPWQRVNEFKFRVSQGTAGTVRDSPTSSRPTRSATNGTLAKSTLGNRFLKPETAKETEFGLDIIFDNRYSLQLSHAHDAHDRRAACTIPLPAPSASRTQWQNAGTVVGNTLEATLEAQMLSPRLDARGAWASRPTARAITSRSSIAAASARRRSRIAAPAKT